MEEFTPFRLDKMFVLDVRLLKDKYLKLILGQNNKKVEAIGFGLGKSYHDILKGKSFRVC